MIDVGHANDREHVDARCQGDIGQSELVAAQPSATVSQSVFHLRHLLQQNLLTIGDKFTVAIGREHLGSKTNVGLVCSPLADLFAQFVFRDSENS